jgi:glutamate/tyrosine decarboxylase-like PLP-dependent enzyme
MPPPVDDRSALEGLLRQTCEEAIRFLAGLRDRPVNHARPLGPLPALPQRGTGADAALTALLERYGPSFTASVGPRYFGFVTGGTTPAALAGDWLTSAIDQNASDTTSVAAAHIEASAVAMLRSLLGLPPEFEGRFVSGATMSNFVGLAIGRQWWGRQHGVDMAGGGAFGLPGLTVLSGAPHSCIAKSLSMLGVGRDSLRRVRTLPGREAVDVAALGDALRAEAGRPCLVVANAGVVNTADFDDIAAMLALRREHPFYLHVDAAFGGFAACSPRYRSLLDGWEQADSIAVDAHKWLNVPYDSGVQLTRHTELQAEVFHNAGAAYLGGPNEADALHMTPENSRRLRALPAWMTLMAYGADGYREVVESSCRCAAWLGERIAGSSAFRLLSPVRMNVVAFTLNQPRPSRDDVAGWLARVRDDGRTYLTPTTCDGTPGARAAFSNWRTTIDDVEVAWRSMSAAAGAAE